MTPAQSTCDSSWFFAVSYLGDDGAEAIAEVLTINKSLAEVKLHGGQADCLVSDQLARSLGLILLNQLIADCQFGARGGLAIAKALMTNNTVAHLDLSREKTDCISFSVLCNRSLCSVRGRGWRRSCQDDRQSALDEQVVETC